MAAPAMPAMSKTIEDADTELVVVQPAQPPLFPDPDPDPAPDPEPDEDDVDEERGVRPLWTSPLVGRSAGFALGGTQSLPGLQRAGAAQTLASPRQMSIATSTG
jgi:hypothetical protein